MKTAPRCNTLQHNATHYNTMQHTTTHCNKLQHNATHITHSPTEARRKVSQYQSLFNLSLFTGICLFSQEFVSFHRNMSLFTGLCHFAQNHVSLDRKGGQRSHALKRLYTRLEIFFMILCWRSLSTGKHFF